MTAPLPLVTLAGSHVELIPLSLDHAETLLRLATDPREPYTFTSIAHDLAGMRAYIQIALDEQARGLALPFATRARATGELVGSTRFARVERWDWPRNRPEADRIMDAVEIGWTWLSPDGQRTGINTEAKLLMLAHAFETWAVRRVVLKTDSRNQRSRDAIARLGFHFEGVLRQHGPGWDGSPRDVAYFTLLEPEWPAVKATLVARLQR